MIDPIQGSWSPEFHGPRPDPTGGAIHTKVMEKLAQETGLDLEELQSNFEDGSLFRILREAGIDREDMREIHSQAMQEALDEGLISEADAERMRPRPPGPPQDIRPDDPASSMSSILEQLVSELGIEDVEQLLELLPENTSLWEFAQEHGVELLDSGHNFNAYA